MLLSCKRVLRLADQIYDVHGGEGAAAAAAAGAGARRAVVTKTCKLQHYNMQGILFLSATYSSGGDGGGGGGGAAAVSSSITHKGRGTCSSLGHGGPSNKGRGTCSSLGHGGPSNHIISGGRDAITRLSDDANHDVDAGYSEQQPFECGRTFCPPEMGEHCPLDRQSLSQPRGDPSLILQHSFHHGPLHRINRSLKCPHAYHALLVDAAGTLIAASQSTQQIYHEIGLKYGIPYSQEEIAAKYKAAYGQPWCRYRMRYEDDGRLFWQCIVQEATGCKDPALLEDLYHYYTTEKAWHIGDPDAEKALKAISAAGIKIAVVSNFDTRLRPLMRVLQCYDWFDTIVVSAEVGVEKPNPEIFWTACQELGMKPDQVLHVGDDKTNDIVGASAAGCDSLLWGVEVASFAEVAQKLGVKV